MTPAQIETWSSYVVFKLALFAALALWSPHPVALSLVLASACVFGGLVAFRVPREMAQDDTSGRIEETRMGAASVPDARP